MAAGAHTYRKMREDHLTILCWAMIAAQHGDRSGVPRLSLASHERWTNNPSTITHEVVAGLKRTFGSTSQSKRAACLPAYRFKRFIVQMQRNERLRILRILLLVHAVSPTHVTSYGGEHA